MNINYDFGCSKILKFKDLENIDSFSCVLTDRNTPVFFEDFSKLTSKNPINIFYLLQDYEPFFGNIDSYAVIYASYSNQFKYITAGVWLKEVLINIHNIKAKNICSFNLGVDYSIYKIQDDLEKKVFEYIKDKKNKNINFRNTLRSWICLKEKIKFIPIYGRGNTPRRCLELIIDAIEYFIKNDYLEHKLTFLYFSGLISII